MRPSGHMYLLNPENGNLVNTQTGKDIEIISWEDLVKDVKKIVIGIDGNMIYAPGVENAIVPFQEWMTKEHPEVEVSLHSGPVRNVMILDETVVVVEAHAYGMSVVTARALGNKLGKMAKFIQMDDPDFNRELNLEVTTDGQGNLISIKENPCSSKAMNIPLGNSETMTEQEKDKLCKDVAGRMEDILQQRREDKDAGSSELIKSDFPLINQHFTAGISPGRFYMMGAHTDASKSKLVGTQELNLALNKAIAFNGRQMRVYIGFDNNRNPTENNRVAKALAEVLPEIAGTNWVGVERDIDADLGLVFDGQWWIIVKARGCIELMGKRLTSPSLVRLACGSSKVPDSIPKTPDTPKRNRMNAYDVNWEEASQGILIIVDVQEHMTCADSELNGQMLRRVTDAILSKNLNANISIKGDTECDYETRLVQEFTDAHCVINIAGGEAEIEKFRMFPDLVGVELW